MALKEVDRFEIQTQQGDCEIQLLCGDITRLPVEEKVDFLLISAFPGNYFATQRSVIGALKSKLSINVEELAMYKEMDLRKHFYCWMSKKLPDYQPYNRLVCIERNYKAESGSLAEQIRTMFRAFVPLFNNEPSTVITPLLGTGSQGHNKASILKSTVEAARHWICAGLPLRLFKIVIYSQNPDQLGKQETELIELFSKLKKPKKIPVQEEKAKKKDEVIYDVYLSYSLEDEQWADFIFQLLDNSDSEKRVYRDRQIMKKDEIFQDHIFKIMIRCQRVIAILSPKYLDSSDCIEQFNIAMCCNRMRKSHILAPFYIETITSMPTYMSLVQFVDCRVRKDGDDIKVKIKNGCSSLIESVQHQETTYDVFISYSHRNPKEAEVFLKYFTDKYPDLKIFFDRSELKTGNLWQKTLYEALDCSRCIVSLISSSYLTSAVCQEEYSIALAKSLVNRKSVKLIAVCIEDFEKVPAWLRGKKIIDGRENLELIAPSVCDAIYQWIDTQVVDGVMCTNVQHRLSLNETLESAREDYVKKNYVVKYQNINPVEFNEEQIKHMGKYRIVVSYAPSDYTNAIIWSSLMKEKLSSVEIVLTGGQVKDTFKPLEDADMIVIFLSRSYIRSVTLMEHLHMSLVRHRSSSDGPVVHFVLSSQLPKHPIFVQLLPCTTSLVDDIWFENTKLVGNKTKSFRIKNLTGFEGSYSIGVAEFMALHKVMWDVLIELSQKGKDTARNVVIQNIVQVDVDQKNALDSSNGVPLAEYLQSISETKVQPISSSTSKDHKDPFQTSDCQDESTSKDHEDPSQASKCQDESHLTDNCNNSHSHSPSHVAHQNSLNSAAQESRKEVNTHKEDSSYSRREKQSPFEGEDDINSPEIITKTEVITIENQNLQDNLIQTETTSTLDPEEMLVSDKTNLNEIKIGQDNKNLNSNSSPIKTDDLQQMNSSVTKENPSSFHQSSSNRPSPASSREKHSTKFCLVL